MVWTEADNWTVLVVELDIFVFEVAVPEAVEVP